LIPTTIPYALLPIYRAQRFNQFTSPRVASHLATSMHSMCIRFKSTPYS
jgi:hypothetical protein